MDHVVYVDAKAKARDMEEILANKRTMIIRGASGRKLPYGRVNKGDILYLIRNNGEGLVKGKCVVDSVLNSEKLAQEESVKLVENNQNSLNLTEIQFKKWAGKRYIVLIGIRDSQKIDGFKIDRSAYSNMDDWLLVEKIENIRID
ncbi:MAG: hypothetical protein ACW967_07190 [Candidatus Hodarchaeales archaeon]|jgi:hypothetical protein